MKKTILSFLAFSLSFCVMAQGGGKQPADFTKSWEDVARLEKQAQPKSALDKVAEIEKQAQEQGNRQQQIKALFYRSRLQSQITQDASLQSINDVQQFKQTSTDVVEQAFLSSVLAQLFYNYYAQNRWQISQRAVLKGTIPDDIKEWSENIFQDTITSLTRLSLVPAVQLQQTPAITYADLLVLGKDSRTQRPTMFDLLSFRAIETELFSPSPLERTSDETLFLEAEKFITLPPFQDERLEIFRNLLKFHLIDKQPDALVMADLSRLEYVYRSSDLDNRGSLFLQRLDGLLQQFSNESVSVEVMERKARFLMEERNELCREEDFNRTLPQKVYDLVSSGIRKFPNYPRIGILKDILAELTGETVHFSVPGTVRTNQPVRVKIHYANVTNPTVTLWRYEMEPVQYEQANETVRKQHRKKITVRKLNLKPSNFYIAKDTIIEFTPQSFGIYGISVAAPSAQEQTTEFRVTDLIHLTRMLPDSVAGNTELIAMDSETGAPLQDVAVRLYQRTYGNNGAKLTFFSEEKTDKAGHTVLNYKSGENHFTTQKGGDKYAPFTYNYYYPQQPLVENERAQFAVFTDRAIYRPGQAVFFKSIAYRLNKNYSDVLIQYPVQVVLLDANHQRIAEKTLTTNEFGSITTSFVLPENVRSGSFSITVGDNRNGSGWKQIRVEEYKRPTFEVNFDTQTATNSFGDTVNVTGKVQSLMGVASPGAVVKYRIIRQPDFFWRAGFVSEKQVAQGETKSDENGKFSFLFIPQKEQKNKLNAQYYRYLILVEATDMAGETQKNNFQIPVGERSMRIVLNVPVRLLNTSVGNLSVSTQNLNGEPVQASVNYSIYLLNDVAQLSEENTDLNKLTRAKQVASGTIESNQKDWAGLQNPAQNWQSGYYRFVLETKDDKGRTVLDSVNTIIFRKNEKMPPVKTFLWVEEGQTQLAHGDTAKFRVGSSLNDVWLRLDVRSKQGESKREWIQLSNEIRTFEIPFEKTFGTAMEVEFFFVKNGKFYRYNLPFNRKEEKKELALQLTTFRDKLEPGGKEEWTLQVPERKGGVEVLAAMYDASLDKMERNVWEFSPVFREYLHFSYWQFSRQRDNTGYLYWNLKRNPIVYFSYDKFVNLTGYYIHYTGNFETRQKDSWGSPMVTNEAMIATDAVLKSEDIGFTQMEIIEEKIASISSNNMGSGSVSSTENVQLRTNFAETAFFYPQLKTNEKGEVQLSFTVPESLTRWRFMGLAHTADLYTGQVEKEVVTQKAMMVMPNLPRFLRQGDHCILTANIINLSETSQSGKATLELINPMTEKVIITKSADFSVEAGKTTVVSWSFQVPANEEIVTCRIIGKSATHSDGEQRMLPVLSNKMLITESLPMTVRSNQTKTFTFDKLKNNKSKTLQSRLLKLEFTANPAWYAVQAFPTITTPESQNTFSIIGAYYASTLATHIARSQPKIAAMIEVWKKQGGTKETLLSNLEKNQELKNILLQETPWVLDAANETEQKQRLSLLFDLNTQQENATRMMNRLRELQLPDGSFSWFTRMSGSRHITKYVLEQMARLIKLGAVQYDSETKQMQMRALNYLDREIQRDFENFKKKYNNKKIVVNSWQIYYLSVRSAYRDIPINKDALEAHKFYYGLVKGQWTNFGLYEKAISALALYNYGDKQIAANVVNSLREHSTTTEEMGMFWDKNRAGYFWNQSPIATHTSILDAFAGIEPDSEKLTNELNEMRIWLLKQKQTQRWESTPATVNAIYALLLRGSEWLAPDNQVAIKMDGKAITPQNPEAGTGYFTQRFSGDEIKPALGEVQITKKGNDIAWGALYWQYQEELDKIEKSKTSLHVEKTMMLEQVTARGRELLPITEKTILKVGDKVAVRLVIRADRDLEFVALQDQRAACLEPVAQLSGYQCRERLCYFQSPKDASMQYFFDRLPQGTYVMEYPLWVTSAGEYTNGITTLQCLYAPEFVSHTGSVRLKVE